MNSEGIVILYNVHFLTPHGHPTALKCLTEFMYITLFFKKKKKKKNICCSVKITFMETNYSEMIVKHFIIKQSLSLSMKDDIKLSLTIVW
jgi:hypothetical protein